MRRWLASSVLIATGAWLALQPTGCAYEVPDLVSSTQTGSGGAGVGAGGTGTTTPTAATGMGGEGGGGSKPCDPDNSLCTGCPDTCDPLLGCGECNGDEDCEAPAIHCVAGRCLACGDASHCLPGEVCSVVETGGSPQTACTAPCQANADCDDHDARCRDGRCVECAVQDPDCNGDDVCDLALGICERCVVDADCANEAGRPYCGADGECHECNVDLQCPGNGVCVNSTCVVACCGDEDCTEGVRTVCNTATSECVQCIGPADCGAGVPYCTAGLCAQCTAATEATDCLPPTPHCYGGTCTQCTPATEGTDCASPTPYCGPADTCVQCTVNGQCPSLMCVDNACL
ncbi:MAG: hypothetical protein HOV80_37260 [Polyangiaceae bacterium]|nr:hypothetical protein [Polyangiaceae bacterium]